LDVVENISPSLSKYVDVFMDVDVLFDMIEDMLMFFEISISLGCHVNKYPRTSRTILTMVKYKLLQFIVKCSLLVKNLEEGQS